MAHGQHEQYTLLIVDDETELREVIESQLHGMKLDRPLVIDQAENGAEAIKLCSSKWYDAILSDINMPVMNGIQFLGELRSHGKDTPFIFLTAHGDKSKAVEALRLGAFDFLDKPWKADILRKVVGSAVELGASLREIEDELDRIVGQYPNLTEERKKQIRNVHRSILLMKSVRVA